MAPPISYCYCGGLPNKFNSVHQFELVSLASLRGGKTKNLTRQI